MGRRYQDAENGRAEKELCDIKCLLKTKTMLSSISTSFLSNIKRTRSSQMYIKKRNNDKEKISKAERRRGRLIDAKAEFVNGIILQRA